MNIDNKSPPKWSAKTDGDGPTRERPLRDFFYSNNIFQ